MIDKKLELFIGLVAPVGVDLTTVCNWITDYLKRYGYKVEVTRLSELIKTVAGLETEIIESPESKRISSYMTAGNEARKKANRGDFLTALAVQKINQARVEDQPKYCTAYVLNSLKHPDEVKLLRNVYGDGFYLIGISSSRDRRKKSLNDRHDIPMDEADALLDRDESEESEHGQHTRDAFFLSDAFVDFDEVDADKQIGRIFDLIFGHPYITPTKDEYAMFMAFSAALRSGDLSRQVGAMISSENGELIATGANDVPCFGGGLYWIDHGENDNRDYRKGYDSNEKRRNEIADAIFRKIGGAGKCEDEAALQMKAKKLLKESGIYDIIEYGRAVHAEMEALLCCARIGVSPRYGTLYSTTFPCHNCAKHIIAAGISTVVFVEPYPKSMAKTLHEDEIFLAHESEEHSECEKEKKVVFKPFFGIGPRKFIDLFSMRLSRGGKMKRKEAGKILDWKRGDASLRVPLYPLSYIDKELLIIDEIDEQLGGEDDNQKK